MSSINGQSSFLENIQRLQNEYYRSSPKSTIFKKQQKLDCAQQISMMHDINQLYSKTVFIIPNTNSIWIDYNIFKLYANPGNYDKIIKYLLDNISYVLTTHGSFNIHINLNTFTISSAERYKDSINLFCTECVKLEMQFANSLTAMYIYNTPSVMDSISLFFVPLISSEMKGKIVMYGKKESVKLIDALMTQ